MNYYAIIIGAGIGGLGVAGVFQDKGYKTLVIEKTKSSGGRSKTQDIPGGWKLDTGTSCTLAQAQDKPFREKTLAVFIEVVQKMFPKIEWNLVWKYEGYVVGIDGLSRSPGKKGRYRPPVYLDEVPGLYFAGDCFMGRGVGMNSAC